MFDSFRGKAMEALEDNVGGSVQAKYVVAGQPRLIAGKLQAVSRFEHIEIKSLDVVKRNSHRGPNSFVVNTSPLKIPFIGIRIAIQKVENGENGKIIYDNFLIPDNYNLADFAGLSELAELLYGQELMLTQSG